MESGKVFTSLFVCVLFWSAIVLLLLSFQGEVNDKAIATPLTADSEKTAAVIDSFIHEKHIPPASEISVDPYQEISGEIQKGESFDQAMRRLDISDSVRINIIKGFDNTLDFTELQPGDCFTICLDKNNSITRATYSSGVLDTQILERNEDGSFLAVRQEVSLVYKIERISGVIETSLYSAFANLEEAPKLIHAYADIFASKIDFNTETRAGDKFELLVEKYYKDDVLVGYGKILVARYQNDDITYEGYHYASDKTPAGFFDKNGEALGTWFIRSPIPFGRVTSRFTMRRKHPIDGVVRPHLGVDLAAPRGTPVMAAADGKVEYFGRRGGFGKTIILRHNGGYKTYYGHLNGFKKGLRTGKSVNQKDIIGYVGSTGISTGPHLDYRIQHNGVFRNPFGIKFKARTVLLGEELELFRKVSDQAASLFNTNTSKNILQVKNVTLSEKNRISFL